jgi:DNA polymerase III gamma/tau subunit
MRSGGALRDAQGLLDQAANFTEGKIGLPDVEAITGSLNEESLSQILDASVAGDAPVLLGHLGEMLASGHEPRQILFQLIERVRSALFSQEAGVYPTGAPCCCARSPAPIRRCGAAAARTRLSVAERSVQDLETRLAKSAQLEEEAVALKNERDQLQRTQAAPKPDASVVPVLQEQREMPSITPVDYAMERSFKMLQDILGPDRDPAIEQLLMDLRYGYVSHAYLIGGRSKDRNWEVAWAFAQALLCENPSFGLPCGWCPSCRSMINQGAHPDLHVLEAGGASLKMEQVKDLRPFFSYGSVTAKHHVYLIRGPEFLTPPTPERPG